MTPEIEARTTRGRPKVLFKPGPEAEDMGHGARNYKLLATIPGDQAFLNPQESGCSLTAKK